MAVSEIVKAAVEALSEWMENSPRKFEIPGVENVKELGSKPNLFDAGGIRENFGNVEPPQLQNETRYGDQGAIHDLNNPEALDVAKDDFFDAMDNAVDELLKEEKIDKQNKAIEDALEKGVDNMSPLEKGNFGEMCTDNDMRKRGYERISKDMVTDINDNGRKGIDGVYENRNGQPRYIIVESKYGSSQLIETTDGKQLSDEWVDKRLDGAVGKEKADEIRLEQATNPDNVEKAVAKIDAGGNVTYQAVDGKGNIISGKEVF